METNCCAELQACDTGTECATFAACLGACTDLACLTGCRTNNPNGADALWALIQCSDNTATSCVADACPSGKICDSGYLATDLAACGTCAGTNCCTEFTDCGNDADCDACLADNTGTACATNAAYGAVHTCIASHCSTLCHGQY
jgi:hypothetical protein